MIIIDEVSMVSSQLLVKIHSRLRENFGVTDETPFAGNSILLVGDFYQLSPVKSRPVFDTEGLMVSV